MMNVGVSTSGIESIERVLSLISVPQAFLGSLSFTKARQGYCSDFVRNLHALLDGSAIAEGAYTKQQEVLGTCIKVEGVTCLNLLMERLWRGLGVL